MADDVLMISRKGQLAELWAGAGWKVGCYLVGCLLLGAVGGLAWSALTPLASYTIRDDLVASISERGQTQIVAADVVFSQIMAVLGLVCGVAGWLVLHRVGWRVIVAPLLGSSLAGAIAWQVGLLVGQGGFAQRLAAASPGDVVTIDLQLRSLSALLVAPFAAITPIMLLAAFWPERRPDAEAGQQPDGDR